MEQFQENSSRYFFSYDTRNYFHAKAKLTTRCVQTSNHWLIQPILCLSVVVVMSIVTWHRYSQPDRTKGRVTSRKKNYDGTHPTRSAMITRTWTYTECFKTSGTSRGYHSKKIQTLRIERNQLEIVHRTTWPFLFGRKLKIIKLSYFTFSFVRICSRAINSIDQTHE